ncbi:hypothetical protein LKD70_18150 [Ruminococcus sp. CLA-AA-H200]|uniref:Uncharacterized protein n=1 Tax=Ruminococcus turbiniformis TaxID=2881258 RepID=A0ABS8G211_9FIRM|nr:hypothetical protein [Ruminococcus turbiniformis]MCC2256301.1 hypothetical protein [Ruminococcus turbiniformis]
MNLSQIARLQALKKHLEIFQNNHPRLQPFLEAVNREVLKEGSVVEISVTSPEGKTLVTNMKLKKEDLEFIRALHELQSVR